MENDYIIMGLPPSDSIYAKTTILDFIILATPKADERANLYDFVINMISIPIPVYIPKQETEKRERRRQQIRIEQEYKQKLKNSRARNSSINSFYRMNR